MEQTILNFLILVGRIFMVPVTIIMVAAVILVPAAGLKKILGEVVQEMRDEKRQRTRDRLYRKSVLHDDNESIREWIWGRQHTKSS